MRDQHAEQYQRQEQVVVKGHRVHLVAADVERSPQVQSKETQGINLAHALGAIGDVDWMIQVVQEHPNDLAKTQRNNGQVVAAQAQRGGTQQQAKKPARPAAAGITTHIGACKPSGNIASIQAKVSVRWGDASKPYI